MTHIRRKRILALAAFTLAGAQAAQAAPLDLSAKAEAYLKTAWPADGPGAAVIITDDGKVVYAGGQGLADIKTGTPITPDTVFRLGSITKQFSAAVLLQLIDEGRLSLDDPLSKFLPSYPQPGASATVRQLLNHTVGVQSYTGIPGWMVEENTNRSYTTEEMIAIFRDLPSPSQPGHAFSYNNSGYVLVGAVIEAVTGKPWHQAVEERIAKPLGLRTIRYGVGEAQMAGMAKGYTGGEAGPEIARKIHMSVPHAAGALVGSVEDLAAWAKALHHGKVVSGASYAGMIAPTALPDGETVPYGFGLGREKVRGHDGIGHGGGIFGFSTDSIYIPEEDLFVAVFTNSDDPTTPPGVALRRLAALALGDPYPTFETAQVDPATIEPLLGVYALEEGERRFFERDGKLYTLRSGASETEVFAAGGDRFHYGPASLTWFEIKRDPAGGHVMEMHQQGADEAEKAVRRGPIPPEPEYADVPRATLKRYVGDYSARLGMANVAWGEGDAITIRLGGQRAAPLKPLSATEFQVQGVDAKVVFHLANEAVTKLVLQQGGREIEAERVKTTR